MNLALRRWKMLRMFFSTDINKGLREYESTPDAILVDVRERSEFESGHIAGAINEPLSEIHKTSLPQDKPLFLYCLRGRRSRRAAVILKKMGYTKVESIGGINGYKGTLVKYKLF